MEDFKPFLVAAFGGACAVSAYFVGHFLSIDAHREAAFAGANMMITGFVTFLIVKFG